MSDINWKKIITRPTSPLKASEVARGSAEIIPEELGTGLNNLLFAPNSQQVYWADSEEFGQFGKKLSELSSDLEFLREFADDCEETAKNIVDSSKKIRDKISSGDLESAINLWLEDHEQTVEYSSHYLWSFIPLEKSLKNILEERMKDKGIPEKYFDVFTQKTRLNQNEKEEQELLKIAIQVKENGYTERIEEKLKEHKDKYKWLPVYDYALEPWGIEDFKERIEEINNPKGKLEEKKEP